jgi:uncharacterized membrane protein YvbJ
MRTDLGAPAPVCQGLRKSKPSETLADAAAAVLDSYFNDDPDERKKVVIHLERLDDALDSYREATHAA